MVRTAHVKLLTLSQLQLTILSKMQMHLQQLLPLPTTSPQAIQEMLLPHLRLPMTLLLEPKILSLVLAPEEDLSLLLMRQPLSQLSVN